MALSEREVEIPQDVQSQVFGQFDRYLKLIERTLNVTVISRGGSLKIVGAGNGPDGAKKVLDDLTRLALSGETITDQIVN